MEDNIDARYQVNHNAFGGHLEAHISRLGPTFELRNDVRVNFADGPVDFVYESLADEDPVNYAGTNGWIFRPKVPTYPQVLIIWND